MSISVSIARRSARNDEATGAHGGVVSLPSGKPTSVTPSEERTQMTTPPSDPYSTPPSGDGDDQRPPQQPPAYPGPSDAAAGYPAPPPPYHPPTGYPSGAFGQPPAAQEPPRSIITAARLMFVGAALQALTVVLGLLSADLVREQLQEQQPELTPDEVDAAVALGIGGVAVIGLVAVGLWIWMAIMNRRGRSWARIVATVLGGLNIAFTLFGLSQATGFSAIFQVITIVLAGGILFLLYRPESTAYYNAVSSGPRLYG